MIDTLTVSKRQNQVLMDAREFFAPKTIVGRKELQEFQHEKYNLNSTPQFITKNLKFKAVGEDGKPLRGFYDISKEVTVMDEDVPEAEQKPKKTRKSKKMETTEMVATSTETQEPVVATPAGEMQAETPVSEPTAQETKKPVNKKKVVSKAKGKTTAKSTGKKPVVKKKVAAKGAH